MKKWISAGTALFILQIIMVLLVQSNTGKFEAFAPQASLLGFNPDEVDSVTIMGPENLAVRLKKVNNDWLFPEDKFNARADRAKAGDLLAKLSSLKQGLAVATTREAAKRFKVSEDSFERRIILAKGEQTLGDLFLGTAPSFKMIHARVNGRDEILSINLSAYEAETEYDNWLDTEITKLDKDAITGISLGEVQLSKQGDAWQLAGLEEGKELNAAKAGELAATISGLTAAGIASAPENEDLFANPSLKITVTLAGAGDKTYVFAKPDETANHYVLKRSDLGYLLKVNTWTVDGLRNFDNRLLTAGNEDEDEAANAPVAGPGGQE